MNEFFEQQTGKKIYRFIAKNPGLSSGKIAEILGIKMDLVEGSLNILEKHDKIFSTTEDGCIKYYTKRKRTRDRRTQEIRSEIVDLLTKSPGLYLSQIAEKLSMSAQLAEYHLLQMERNNITLGVKENGGYYRRYYVSTSHIGVKDKRIVALLRQEHLLRIVLIILKNPNIKHKELLEYLDITPGTLSHHLNRLDEYDLIEATTYGREKGYVIKNKQEIMSIIRRYILDLITDSFNDMWEELNIK